MTEQIMNNQTNGTFTFQCVVAFEIDPGTAASLLVESDPSQTVHAWLMTQRPYVKDDVYHGNSDNLRTALGRYLTDKEVVKARLLLPEGDPTKLPF